MFDLQHDTTAKNPHLNRKRLSDSHAHDQPQFKGWETLKIFENIWFAHGYVHGLVSQNLHFIHAPPVVQLMNYITAYLNFDLGKQTVMQCKGSL